MRGAADETEARRTYVARAVYSRHIVNQQELVAVASKPRQNDERCCQNAALSIDHKCKPEVRRVGACLHYRPSD